MITAYVVHRPDGNWSLMLINHDLNASHRIHLVIDEAKHGHRTFAGPVALVQFCNTPSENKNATVTPSPDGTVQPACRVDHGDSRKTALKGAPAPNGQSCSRG